MEDVASLVNNVTKLLDNKALRTTIAQNAYEFVKQYNYDAMATKIEQLFFKMVVDK
jgi:glycosyltransferase involved in cell wall biosynthesis